MKKVLIISYPFPPQNVVGATRCYKLSKYLNKLGWNPYIIARKLRKEAPLDYSTIACLKGIKNVFRANDIEIDFFDKNIILKICKNIINRIIFIPDSEILWNFPLIIKGLKLTKKYDIDIIFCSAPPFSSFIGALIIAKISKSNLFIDLRDLWTLNEGFYELNTNKKLSYMVQNFLERKIFKEAKTVILNTPIAKKKMEKKYPEFKDKYCVITNGYDPRDFKDIEATKFNKFTMLHTGNFYLERNPILFLSGLSLFIKNNENIKNNIQVIFAGRNSENFGEKAIKYGVDKYIIYREQLPKNDLFKYTKGAHLLLLFLGLNTSSDYVIPAKLFEYMAVNKPVLGIVPPLSQAQEIITKYKLGYTVYKDSAKDVEKLLNIFYYKYLKGELGNEIDKKSIAKYEYINITKRLCNIFDR